MSKHQDPWIRHLENRVKAEQSAKALQDAAPELLKACEEALSLLESFDDYYPVDAINSLRAAIAKAKGI